MEPYVEAHLKEMELSVEADEIKAEQLTKESTPSQEKQVEIDPVEVPNMENSIETEVEYMERLRRVER